MASRDREEEIHTAQVKNYTRMPLNDKVCLESMQRRRGRSESPRLHDSHVTCFGPLGTVLLGSLTVIVL
jgi:hypothetical protein